MESVFGATENIKYWQRAFEAHQPLRRLFWESFGSEEKTAPRQITKPGKNSGTYARRLRITRRRRSCLRWHAQTAASGKTRFIRDEVFVPQVVLYRPWTGEAGDKIIQPINVSTGLTLAVRKKHLVLMKNESLKNNTCAQPANAQVAY